MKKFTHCLAVAGVMLAAATGTVRADDGVTLYGDVIFSDSWEETSDYGVYSINTSTGALKAVSPTGDYNFRATGGAVYKNGHFYIIKGDEYSATWYDYNTESWDEENEGEEEPTWLATDMTVNPTDNKIYAVMSDGNGGQELTTVDFDADSRTVIGSLSTNLVTLSADAYGQLYGIGTDGILYKVSVTNAEETSVGSTGVSPSGMQSATFDYGTGNLYWAVSTASGVGALYSVNTTTGAATQVAMFPGNEQIAGLYSLSTAQAWEGPDMPAAPTDVKATYANGQATITWTAPTKGLHNGDFDANVTTYDVMRLPDSTVIASGITETTYTDNFTPSQLGAYTYEVTAKNSVGTGGKARSNVVVAGNAVTPPYSQDFTDESSFALLTTVDGDGDGSTWQPNATQKGAIEAGAPFESTNDWIFTPKLALKADRLYRLRFAVSSELAANYPYTIQAAIGNNPTEDDATQTIQGDTTISVPDAVQLGSYFEVPTDGDYNIGINVHGYDIQGIILHNIFVDEGPLLAAPGSVTNVSANAANDGSAHVSFSFAAPTKTVNGEDLSSISNIKVYRDTTLVATIDNVTPGSTYTAEDNVPVNNAFNNYRIVAENSVGIGLAAEVTVYVGIDKPLPPTNVKATYDPNDASKVIVTWTAPETGVNGGYIDPAHLTYGVQRMIGTQTDILQNAYNGTTFTDDIDNTGEQAYQLYGVSSHNASGYSDIVSSNSVIKGAPYSLPFQETFPNGEHKYFWMATNTPTNGSAAWGIGNDYQSGKYYFQFQQSYNPGDAATISSGKIDPSGAVNPVLEFNYWYRAEAGDDSLNVYLIKNGTDTVLIDDEPYTLYMNSKDFEKVTVPLSQYIDKNTKFIQVAFGIKTYNSDAMQSAAVADVVVRDQQDYDLMAEAITAPSSANAGDTIDVTATVKNYGSKTANKYTVYLYEGDNFIASQEGSSLKADSVMAFTFKVSVGTLKDKLAFSFDVNYDNDLVPDNNSSDSAFTTVTLPVYPTPTDGAGNQNGNQVDLTWKAPSYEQFAVPTTDGADSYEAFAIDNIGQWTVRDRDGKATRSDINVDSYPINFTHYGEPMAWIVMNPAQAGAPFTNWMDEPTGWQPVSGTQYFASMSSTEGGNDDWLISPELSGDAQTISFYQHGYYGIEQFEVLYSTTDTAVANFTSLGQQASAAAWTKVSFDLPAGAKYFAIRNLGGDYSQNFFVDDINYRPKSGKGALKLTGYNIYRDGEKIAIVDANSLDYSDKDATTGNHTYQVTAVYNLGESSSTTIEINVTDGISAISGNNSTRLLNGSRLTTSGPADVYTIDGRLVYHSTTANSIDLPAGTYIIRADGQTIKAIVK